MPKKSLVDQILALSNPQPASFHPDEEAFQDISAARLCDFTYEEEGEKSPSNLKQRSSCARRRGLDLEEEDDPRYAGKVMSREELESEHSGSSSFEGESGRG